MVDGVVGVTQSPTPDRLVDNEIIVNGFGTVYRQRVQDPQSLAELQAIVLALASTLNVDVTATVGLTDAELRATPIDVNAVVTVTDALTDAELRASPVPVSGTMALDAPTLAALETITVLIQAGQVVGLDAGTLAALENITATISGSVAVTGPLTDTELRAAPVDTVQLAQLVPEEYDYVEITAMTGDDIDQIEYRQGGSGGTLVATLDLAYFSPGLIQTIERS